MIIPGSMIKKGSGEMSTDVILWMAAAGAGMLIGIIAVTILFVVLWVLIVQKKIRKKWQELKKMDKALIMVLLVVVVFTITMIIIYIRCQSVPDTLILSVYAATIGECSVTGIIKKENIKQENKQETSGADDEPRRNEQ